MPFDVTQAIEVLSAGEAAGSVPRAGSKAGGQRVRRRRPATVDTGVSTLAKPRADGTTAMGDLTYRSRATVKGQVRAVNVTPVGGTPRLECEIFDESGGITLVFFGRRAIQGIQPGARIQAEGMVGDTDGYLTIANPSYALLPDGE